MVLHGWFEDKDEDRVQCFKQPTPEGAIELLFKHPLRHGRCCEIWPDRLLFLRYENGLPSGTCVVLKDNGHKMVVEYFKGER